jgi:integron integrase
MHYQPQSGVVTPPAPKHGVLAEVRRILRVHHYSLRTERAYLGWIRRFLVENGRRSPRELGAPHVERFLSSLAQKRGVAPGTQNQALAALLFLYRRVLGVELPWMDSVVRAKRPQRVPTVLAQAEVARLLAHVEGSSGLVIYLLYGSGLRIMEATRLRIKDIDFERREITVRQGKGDKDRRVPLPDAVAEGLRQQVQRALEVHAQDRAANVAGASLPYALARKYPRAAFEPGWQFFPPRG